MELLLTGRRLPRFAFLLGAMLAELMLAPFLGLLPDGLPVVRGITAVVLLAALVVAGAHRLAVALFTAALLLHLTTIVSSHAAVTMASYVLRIAFLGLVVAVVVRRVLADRAVTLDTMAGAACAYMLLGLVFGDLFLLLQGWRPDSFHVPDTWLHGADGGTRSSLVYFSFATLTTLGYGEIHPNGPAAGSLCTAEALIGQLYLAIMIARLVGLHTTGAGGGDTREGPPAAGARDGEAEHG